MGFGFGKKMSYEEYDQHGALWWIGRIITLILVCGTVGILFWRIFTSGDPKDLKGLQPNQPLADAYNAARAEDKELTVYYNEQLPNITYEKGRRGYFSAQRVRFIGGEPGAGAVPVQQLDHPSSSGGLRPGRDAEPER